MSNLYKLLNSNKILKTWCTIYAMFLTYSKLALLNALTSS